MTERPIRRALVSVYDKTGLAELGRGLADAQVEIVSTGSSAAVLADAGVPVTRVADLTGFPEVLDGRVKTLHPSVHAGLLADPARADHARQLGDLDIEPFDLLIGNLYPFREAVASGATSEECVELIDIGGPAMVRAAAKNHAAVAVVVDPARYPEVLAAVADDGFSLARRRELAAEAFQHTASYDIAVATYMDDSSGRRPTPERAASESSEASLPGWVAGAWKQADVLRYGENPHQPAALYVQEHRRAGTSGPAVAELLHGKAMSYNNYVDADAAWRAVHDFDQPCVAIVKHANPCGIAVADEVAEAHRKAHDCDPVSAFGGVIAVNRSVSVALARRIAEIFTEVVIAPAFDDGALDALMTKKNVRLLRCPAPGQGARWELRQISGGMLMQGADVIDAPGDDPRGWRLLAGPAGDARLLAELEFVWRAARSVKSNAIVLASDRATVGVGMGQVNRVDAARLAVSRAGERATAAVAASDAYFPFPDGLEVLAEAGVRAVVQPGGSVRDEEVAAAADKAGLTMYGTGTRHFYH